MNEFQEIPFPKIVSGKVREVFDIGRNELVIVTTDRISSFDVILDSKIPKKGIALNKISNFWFDFTKDIVSNHLVATELCELPAPFQHEDFKDRTIKVKKLKMLPFEIIVRGYLFGSMWKAYQSGEEFCGLKFSGVHQQAEKLDKPIITPSAKSSEGHDINITLEQLAEGIGQDLADKICDISLRLYEKCFDYAIKQGIIIADTKFEFGLDQSGNLVLADEIFTPDSSRFWDAAAYRVGESPKSYDKQFVRDWLIQNKLDGVTPAPRLPENIIEKTAGLYAECCKKLTGEAI
ncbi:MAG TPA: phosphoribosylaminoimidazolesuccinocarboxamide synthase [Oscillospiraceae bacterium]|nr:phosphoribosylaminoimidazolesuccinocarboxamide synthase [Oscillospiraceae bacterium]HPK34509.1 phosphoribosylaminoimidazolesuccinocarboxamide synthase [Oscillospiraceae bacterium]HPR74737.1 phosphoribosylaminoimidazolesuccinocarboxamide synthase [Oscillospiraceae bacterium]